MTIKTFRFKGKFLMGEKMQPFVWECRAYDETKAYEKIYSEFGSKHKAPRSKIKIIEVKEIAPEDAQNPEIRVYAGLE